MHRFLQNIQNKKIRRSNAQSWCAQPPQLSRIAFNISDQHSKLQVVFGDIAADKLRKHTPFENTSAHKLSKCTNIFVAFASFVWKKIGSRKNIFFAQKQSMSLSPASKHRPAFLWPTQAGCMSRNQTFQTNLSWLLSVQKAYWAFYLLLQNGRDTRWTSFLFPGIKDTTTQKRPVTLERGQFCHQKLCLQLWSICVPNVNGVLEGKFSIIFPIF